MLTDLYRRELICLSQQIQQIPFSTDVHRDPSTASSGIAAVKKQSINSVHNQPIIIQKPVHLTMRLTCITIGEK